MNQFSALLLAITVVALCAAEPANLHRARFVSQRQVLDTTTELDATTEDGKPYAAAGYRPEQEFNYPGTTDANSDREEGPEQTTGPYPAAGWQPAGQLLNVPVSFQRQLVQFPRTVYGQPDATTTNEYDSTTTNASSEFESNETTDEPESELLPNSALVDSKLPTNGKLQKLSRSQKLTQGAAPAQNEQSTYYVTLADGSVQPVAYYQFPTNAAGGQVSARVQIQPQQAAVVAQSPAAFVHQSPFRSAAFVQAPTAFLPAGQSTAFVHQASPSAAYVHPAPRSAAFVQAPFVQQPQYYVHPYAYPSSAVSYSSQYQSSW